MPLNSYRSNFEVLGKELYTLTTAVLQILKAHMLLIHLILQLHIYYSTRKDPKTMNELFVHFGTSNAHPHTNPHPPPPPPPPPPVHIHGLFFSWPTGRIGIRLKLSAHRASNLIEGLSSRPSEKEPLFGALQPRSSPRQ
jgi:hypothetical protein